jgi:hypothetical protein
MSTMTIKTNNIPRDVLAWFDLTRDERANFAHYRGEDDGAAYVRYGAWVYDLSDTPRAPSDLSPWDGMAAETYFSGVLFRFVDDGERVVCGRYYS